MRLLITSLQARLAIGAPSERIRLPLVPFRGAFEVRERLASTLMGKTPKKLSFIVISILLSLLFVEFCSWLLYETVVPKRGRRAVAFILGHPSPSADLPVQKLPYYFYINRPAWRKDGLVQHNSYGHRGQDISVETQDDTLRILTIGGSTTYGWLLDSWEEAWPAQLQGVLQEKLRCRVEVMNAGLPGGMSSEGLVDYLFRDRYFQPQIVVIHSGGNDAGPLLFSDYRPDYSTYRSWESSQLTVRRGERTLLSFSYLARFSYGLWLSDWRTGNIVPMPTEWPPREQAMSHAEHNRPLGYRRYLDLLVRNVRHDGAVPVLFPFYLASQEVFELVEPEYRSVEPLYDATKYSIGKNTHVMKEIAQHYEVPFAMLPEGSIPLEYFFDHAHLKKEGELIKAKFIGSVVYDLVTQNSANRADTGNRRLSKPWPSACVEGRHTQSGS